MIVSYGRSRGFLLICFSAAFKYLAVVIIMYVTVEVGMVVLWGNQETVCSMKTELVACIQILCHQ